MNLAALVHSLRCSLLRIESRLLQVAGLEQHLGEFNDYRCRRYAAANLVTASVSD